MKRFAAVRSGRCSACLRSLRPRRRRNIRAAPSPSSCRIRPAGRPTRPRASVAQALVGKARTEFHRRKRHRRQHHHRHQHVAPSRRPTATRCCCTICRSRRTSRCSRICRSIPPKTSRRSCSSTRTRWCWSAAQTLAAEHAEGTDRLDEEGALKMAHPGLRHHRPSRLGAVRAGGRGQGRSHSLSRRGAGDERSARRSCRSVLRHAAVDRAARSRPAS